MNGPHPPLRSRPALTAAFVPAGIVVDVSTPALATFLTLVALGVVGAVWWHRRRVAALSRELGDATQRVDLQREIERLSRLSNAITQVNHSIIHATSRAELLNGVCQSITQHGELHSAWVGWVDEATQRVTPMAASGDPQHLLPRLKVSLQDSPEGRGTVGRCVRTGEIAVSNEFLSDPDTAPWHDLARQAGLEAAAAMPIRLRGRICGALVMYASVRSWFQAPELALLERAAQDISYGLDRLDDGEQRQRAVAALSASERSYREIFNATNEAIFIVDVTTGRLIDLNEAMLRMYAFDSKEEALRKTIGDLSAGEPSYDQAAAERWLERTQLEGPQVFEWLARRQDGGHFWTEVSLRSSSIGGEGRILAVVRDVSSRKQAEDRLRLQDAALRAAANVVVITDRSGQIVWINPAFTTASGYTPEEALGQNPRILKSGHHAREFYRHLWETILAGEVWHGQITNLRKDGTSYIEENTITPVRDNRGDITHFIAIKQDITERKALETRLLRAQRLESIGTLAGGVAHDLNNILTPILMSVDMLRQESLRSSAPEFLDLIQQSARRGAAIIKQLLAFGRGGDGPRAPVQPRHLVREIARLAQETFPRNIRIVEESSRDMPTVNADITELHQVVLNLCVNARDAMPAGGELKLRLGTITLPAAGVPATAETPPGNYVLLSVSDTGTGMSPEVQERIFDPFFTTKPLGQGTGLGLSTVLGIVRSHGGFIDVESQPGRGSEFRVYLPAEAEPVPSSTSPSPLSAPRGQGALILLADDEEAVRSLLRTLLIRHGYRVLTAANGGSAMDLLVRSPGAQLLVTDLMMPVMDGISLFRAVRASGRKLPIIALTGLGPDTTCEDVESVGFDAILTKPCESQTVLQAVHDVLQRQPRTSGKA